MRLKERERQRERTRSCLLERIVIPCDWVLQALEPINCMGVAERRKMIWKRTPFEYKIAGVFMQTYSVGLSETNHPCFTHFTLLLSHLSLTVTVGPRREGGRPIILMSEMKRWENCSYYYQ